jgi:hypothetical protein
MFYESDVVMGEAQKLISDKYMQFRYVIKVDRKKITGKTG